MEYGEYGTISGTSMASPHVAGALALRASANNPGNAADVYKLYDSVIDAGNSNWVDDSGDGINEPLLDVSNTSLFNPVLVSSGGGGTTNEPPSATISSPADNASFVSGAAISFSGSGNDSEDGDLTDRLVWTSDKDEQIGTGDSFSAVLSDGTHIITASVTDSGGEIGTDSVTINVTAASGGNISLSVSAYKVRGAGVAELAWSGATSSNVYIYRNGGIHHTTSNDTTPNTISVYTDDTLGKGGGSATYQVCEADSPTCSNIVTVSW